jgi:hypothetical protein
MRGVECFIATTIISVNRLRHALYGLELPIKEVAQVKFTH